MVHKCHYYIVLGSAPPAWGREGVPLPVFYLSWIFDNFTEERNISLWQAFFFFNSMHKYTRTSKFPWFQWHYKKKFTVSLNDRKDRRLNDGLTYFEIHCRYEIFQWNLITCISSYGSRLVALSNTFPEVLENIQNLNSNVLR